MGNSLEGRDTLTASRITGVCRHVLQGDTGGVFTLAFAAHDQQLISGSFDQTTRVWNLQTGESVKVLRGHTGGIWGCVAKMVRWGSLIFSSLAPKDC